MAAVRRVVAALVVGSALIARPAVAQQRSSVSLTHTLTVTVPPRVKVQIGAPVASATKSANVGHSNGLSVSISATQSWILSMGSAKQTGIQWSRDVKSGFAGVPQGDVTIASGEISGLPAAATLFFRNGRATHGAPQAGFADSDPVILTVVAP